MSKSEKRYFKLSSFKQDSIYHRFFDLIAAQPMYDAVALKVFWEKEQIGSSIARIQHHLYELILKSLAAYQQAKHPRYEILDAIKYYLLLKDRGLHEQGRQRLQKALKLALTYNFYGLAVEIYDLMEDWVTEESSYKKAEGQQGQLQQLRTRLQSYQQELLLLKEKIYELRLFYLKHQFARTTTQKTFLLSMAKVYNQQLETEQNSLKKRLLLTILIYVYYGLQDYKQLIGLERQRLNLWKENYWAAHISPFLIYAYHRNLLWILLTDKQYAAHQALVEQLEQSKILVGLENSSFYTIKLTLAKTVTQLYAKVAQQQYYEAYQQISALWQLQEEYPKHWDENLLVHSLILCMQTTFCLGKYKEAMHWLHVLERDVSKAYLLPYKNMGKIAHVLIHHALGDEKYVQNILKSTRIQLYRKHEFFEIATIFLKYFKQQLKTNTKENKHLLLRQYKQELEQIAVQEGQKGFFILFNFVDWFDSQLKGCTIAELKQVF